jgi:hypothetical protein
LNLDLTDFEREGGETRRAKQEEARSFVSNRGEKSIKGIDYYIIKLLDNKEIRPRESLLL